VQQGQVFELNSGDGSLSRPVLDEQLVEIGEVRKRRHRLVGPGEQES
jgi:hypothetical protein